MIDGNPSGELLTNVFGTLTFGQFAVDGFFLLSGYLIVKSWDAEPRIFSFLAKRVLRIYPGFIVASVLCVFVVGSLGAAEPESYFSQIDLRKFISSMVQLFSPGTPPTFLGQNYPGVNGSMWTIRLEFLCYLCTLVLGMLGMVKYRYSWLAISVFFLGAMLCQKLGFEFSYFSFEHPFVRLGMFFFSGGTYYLFRNEISFRSSFSWILGSILTFSMFYINLAELALAVMGGYLLFYFAFSHIPLLRPFQTIPDVSYGLYLYGWPIQKLLLWYFPAISPWGLVACSLVGGVLMGICSWYMVEKPLLKLKPRNSKRASTQPVPVISA